MRRDIHGNHRLVELFSVDGSDQGGGGGGGEDNPRKRISFESFVTTFESICESNRADGRAIAFAFIVADLTDVHTQMSLDQDEYWNALDRLAGKTLSVFAFNLNQTGVLPERISKARDQMLDFLKSRFGEECTNRLPLMLFFQVKDRAVIDSFIVRFEDSGKETVFNEIRSTLSDAVESLDKVQPEFKDNAAEIFALLKTKLQFRSGLKIISAAGRLVMDIRGLLGI